MGDTMVAAAWQIAGGEPPERLIPKLYQLGLMVANARHTEEHQPRRSDVRGRLKEVEQASRFLLSVIDPDIDPKDLKLPSDVSCIVLQHLDGDSPLPWDDLGELRSRLRDLIQRARLAHNKISTKGGRHGAWAQPDAQSAKDLCAIVVTETWIRARKELPAPTHPELHAVAEAYWRATGAISESRDGTEPGRKTEKGRAFSSGWRNHLERARQPSIERDWIISILTDDKVYPPVRHGPIPR